MIVGSHSVIYSKAPGKDRAFLRDVLKLPVVDGGGYLIFGLPSAEASIHETSTEGSIQELYLLCDDIETFISDMKSHSSSCSAAQDTGWGSITEITLPSGTRLHVYEPRHARPADAN